MKTDQSNIAAVPRATHGGHSARAEKTQRLTRSSAHAAEADLCLRFALSEAQRAGHFPTLSELPALVADYRERALQWARAA